MTTDRRHRPQRYSFTRNHNHSSSISSRSSRGRRIMGQNFPKPKVPRSEVRSLQRMISFDEAEIQYWYQEFLESVDASTRCCNDSNATNSSSSSRNNTSSSSNNTSSSSSNSRKYLTREVFVRTYDTVFPGRCEAFAGHVFRTFDRNGDRKLDFREFLTGLSFSSSSDLQKKLAWAFQLYDVDRSGFITLDNMTGIVRAVFQMIGPHALRYNNVNTTAESLAEELFIQMDQDGDQRVSWAEFQEGVARNPTAVQLLQISPPDALADPLDHGGEGEEGEEKFAFEVLKCDDGFDR